MKIEVYIGVVLQHGPKHIYVEAFERKKDAEKFVREFQKDVRSFRRVFERRIHRQGD